MAIVFGNIFGNLSGKVGNLSARIRKGKTIISARPAGYRTPSDAESVSRRNKFISAMQFARQVYKLKSLNAVWKKVKNKKSTVFHQLVSINFRFASPEIPTVKNVLTPGGFALKIRNAAVCSDQLCAVIPVLSSNLKLTEEEIHLSINCVVCFYAPVTKGVDPYKIINSSLLVRDYDFGNEYEFSIRFDVQQKAIAIKYQSAILYAAVVTCRRDGTVVRSSRTFRKQLEFINDQS